MPKLYQRLWAWLWTIQSKMFVPGPKSSLEWLHWGSWAWQEKSGLFKAADPCSAQELVHVYKQLQWNQQQKTFCFSWKLFTKQFSSAGIRIYVCREAAVSESRAVTARMEGGSHFCFLNLHFGFGDPQGKSRCWDEIWHFYIECEQPSCSLRGKRYVDNNPERPVRG